MRYTEFRRKYAPQRLGLSGGAKKAPAKMERLFQGAWLMATTIVAAMVSRALSPYDSTMALLAVLAFAAVAYSWQKMDRASWRIDDSRYLAAPSSAAGQQREHWLLHRALKILADEHISRRELDYLHDASTRAAGLAQQKIAYFAGLVALVAGWCYVLFEAEIASFVATASVLTKLVLSGYLMGIVATFAPVFLNQRFSTQDRIIENTLYDIIHLDLYKPARQGQLPPERGASRSPAL